MITVTDKAKEYMKSVLINGDKVTLVVAVVVKALGFN